VSEKNLVLLVIRVMDMLMNMFEDNNMSMELFKKNMYLKVGFLETYIKSKNYVEEKEIITQILSKYFKLIELNTAAYNVQLSEHQLPC
jgi:hypothetical protein